MQFRKMLDNEKVAKEREATSMGYSAFNAIFLLVALGCLWLGENALCAVVLVASLLIFVIYICMMAMWRKGW